MLPRWMNPSANPAGRESKRQLLRDMAKLKDENRNLCTLVLALKDKIRKLENNGQING